MVDKKYTHSNYFFNLKGALLYNYDEFSKKA